VWSWPTKGADVDGISGQREREPRHERGHPTAILDELMKLAGEQPAGQRATFSGADPILPTPFRIGDLGAAVIAAGAAQAARLFEQRTGMVQTVHVDVDAAAVAMRGSRYPRSLPANPLDYTTGYLAAFLVLVALGLRERDGGSYHIDLSLAQTGRYLTGLSRADAALAAAREPDLPRARLDELMITRRTPFGSLRYFAPVAHMPGTPPRWDLPTVPLDSDRPDWSTFGD
jgi:crotonobetainyl-CoA:carnitine CoA-transferase CaiB-like acyl-CoA transferase